MKKKIIWMDVRFFFIWKQFKEVSGITFLYNFNIYKMYNELLTLKTVKKLYLYFNLGIGKSNRFKSAFEMRQEALFKK